MKDLDKVTSAERLWLWRHAQGLTQAQAAKKMATCLTYYAEIERGEREYPEHWHLNGWRLPLNRWPLARRRSGLSLRQAARQAGLSHVGYITLERANDPRVARFWQARGFHYKIP